MEPSLGGGTLKSLRKALGLGDTLGVLPVECGGTGASSAEDARENLKLDEWFEGKTLHPKGATVQSATISDDISSYDSSNPDNIPKTTTKAVFSQSSSDGSCVTVGESSLTVNDGGFYEITSTGTAGIRITSSYDAGKVSGKATLRVMANGASVMERSLSYSALATKNSSNQTFAQLSGEIFIEAGSEISFEIVSQCTKWNNQSYAFFDMSINVKKI